MQFSLNKKISDKTSQNKDLSQCDIAISRYHNAPNGAPRCISNIAYSIACEALNVIARSCLQRRGNLPEGTPQYKTHARYFCTCVEKKEHTNKRVSIIACNNVISKVQCATRVRYTQTLK